MTPLAVTNAREDQWPLGGLFFFQDEKSMPDIIRGRNAKCTGMAFLIDGNGLIATCAHVILALNKKPGQRVVVHSAVVPISIDADVLLDDWAGPIFGPEGFPETVFFGAAMDERPEVYRHDVALLRLDLSTARWHTGTTKFGRDRTVRIANMADDPLSVLSDAWRILPLGAPGYRPESRSECWSWWVTWVNYQHELTGVTSTFYGVERNPGQFDAILVSSDKICKGFSGSPIWDPQRQLVIGMVRRLLAPKMPGLVRGTDARFMIRHAKLARSVDARFSELYGLIQRSLQADGVSGEMGQSDWGDPSIFIEPSVRDWLPYDPLNEVERVPGYPSIKGVFDILQQSARILLQGAAGFGKSTLLSRIADECIRSQWKIEERHLVPLYITASELVSLKVDLYALLERQRACQGSTFTNDSISQCIEENDASILLLVDGLDEIDNTSQKLLMQRLSAIIEPPLSMQSGRSSFVRHVIVTTRIVNPQAIEAGKTRLGFRLLELLAFNRAQVVKLVERLFQEHDKRENFLNALSNIGWNRNQPSPLQIRIAAEIYRIEGELLRGERELTLHFIDRRLAYGCTHRALQTRNPPDMFGLHYLPNLSWIIEFLAHASHKKNTLSAEDVRSLLNGHGLFPDWLSDRGSFINFLFTEVPGLTGLAWFEPEDLHIGKDQGQIIHWLHRTFADALLARWLLRNSDRDRTSVRDLFATGWDDAIELNILGILHDEKAHERVQETLEQWLRDAALTSGKSSRKAIYALAAGIDANGSMRHTLIKELLRVVLTEFDKAKLCMELFAVDDLPSPISIAKALKPDVAHALMERLHVRITRGRRIVGQKPKVTLSGREAKLFDELDLWTIFGEALDVIDPRKPLADSRQTTLRHMEAQEQKMLLMNPSAIYQSGAITTVTVRDARGDISSFEFDSRYFVRELVELGRKLPQLPSHELLAIFISHVMDAAQIPAQA